MMRSLKALCRTGLLVFASVLLVAQPVGAIDAQFYSGNDIFFYSPEGTCTQPNSSPSVPSTGEKISVFGDSLTVGMRDRGELGEKLIGSGWEVQTIQAEGGENIAWARNKLKDADVKKSVSNSDTVVIAMGTNADDNPNDQVDGIIKELRAINSTLTIFWVNIFTPRDNAYRDNMNVILDSKSSSLDFTVIDWHSEVKDRTDYYEFIPNNIHHTELGYERKADFVVKNVSQPSTEPGVDKTILDSKGCVCETGVVSVGLVGKDNLEKIFNYMRGKGLSDIQAAGVIGNISQESGGDPENTQTGFTPDRTKDPTEVSKNSDGDQGGWGIIQWTPSSKVVGIAKGAGITTPIYELATQLDILWWHMENTSPTGVSNMVEGFRSITEIDEATLYFEDKVEGAGEPQMENRYAAARLALQEFGGGESTSSASYSTVESIADCGGVDSGAAAGNAVQTALNYAWPEYHAPNYLNLKPSYAASVSKAQKEGKYVGGGQHPGVDCGGFVTRVMQDSAVDSEYGGGGPTSTQLEYLLSSPKYKELSNPTSSDLTPGAIAIKTVGGGHTYMYVGKQTGFETQIASASYSLNGTTWRAPMAGQEAPADPEYRWFVLK